MSTAKDSMFNAMEQESLKMEGKCTSCGSDLSAEEKDSGRDECYDCFASREGRE
jgi:hypothetical protein